jgi:hypothetical protein
VGDLAVGGSGRYLILSLPTLRKLAIFDVNRPTGVKYLAIAEDDVKIAAGGDTLVVVLPGSGLLQRWNLTTFERELTVTLPVSGRVDSVCMGSASNGPLLVSTEPPRNDRFMGGSGQLTLLDTRTFKPLPIKASPQMNVGSLGNLRASADGKWFGGWSKQFGGGGLWVLTLKGNELGGTFGGHNPFHAVPGPDGKTVFTGIGLFTADLKRPGAGNKDGNSNDPFGRNEAAADPRYCIPSQQGPFYLAAPFKGWQQFWGQRQEEKETLVFSAYLVDHAKPLPGLPVLEMPIDLMVERDPNRRAGLPRDRLLHLIPEAGLVVLISGDDRLVLQRYDVYEAVKKLGADYLFIRSQPPSRAHKGQTCAYQVATRSSRGGVKYLLKSGPQGMQLSPEGALTWEVPAGFDESEVDVVVSVSDAGGKKVSQAFTLWLSD